MCTDKYIPKVGEVCETKAYTSDVWKEVRVLFVGESLLVAVDNQGVEEAYVPSLQSRLFRKIQSEEEKFVERYTELRLSHRYALHEQFSGYLYRNGFRYVGEDK